MYIHIHHIYIHTHTHPNRWVFCPVNYKDKKDGTPSLNSENWFEGWYDMRSN